MILSTLSHFFFFGGGGIFAVISNCFYIYFDIPKVTQVCEKKVSNKLKYQYKLLVNHLGGKLNYQIPKLFLV